MTLFRPLERRGIVATGSPTYNPFENPSLPLASVGLEGVFGSRNNDSGEDVTVNRATTLPVVYRCISVISTVVAQCQLRVYKLPNQKPVRFPLFEAGNKTTTYTPYELWQLAMAQRAAYGNAFVHKVRENDLIVDLRPLNPAAVEVKLDDEGNKIFKIKQRDNSYVTLSTYEVMHIPGMGYDGLRGFSPIELAAQSIGISLAGDRLAARFYAQGSQLGGIIKVKAPLTSQTQAEGIKARWMNKNSGLQHSGEVAVLDAETDFQSVTIPPDQLQFLESRRWGTTEIARLFGLPPHIVGDVEKSTSWGTGIEQQNIGMVTYTIADYTTSAEQRATREIVGTNGQYAEFDLSRLMRGSMQERFEAYQTAANSGWVTGNEIRDWENMPPMAHLNEPFISPNLMPMGLDPSLNPFSAQSQGDEPGDEKDDASPDGADDKNKDDA